MPTLQSLCNTHLVPRRRKVVIVGAGAAGCVLAGALVATERFHVTLLEHGPDRDPSNAAAPINSADLFVSETATAHVIDVPESRTREVGGPNVPIHGSPMDVTGRYRRG